MYGYRLAYHGLSSSIIITIVFWPCLQPTRRCFNPGIQPRFSWPLFHLASGCQPLQHVSDFSMFREQKIESITHGVPMIVDYNDSTYHYLVLFYYISVANPPTLLCQSPAPTSRNLPDNFCISANIGRLNTSHWTISPRWTNASLGYLQYKSIHMYLVRLSGITITIMSQE